MTSLDTCPGCRLTLPLHDGPTHPYIGASAACWALYGEVLAREYGNPALMGLTHRASVDAYAAQHPGVPGRRATQSVWAHLAGLHVVLERGLPEAAAREVMKQITSSAGELSWLTPPDDPGTVTVADVAAVADLDAHDAQVMRWAGEVWSSWRAHHHEVRALVDTVVRRPLRA